MDTALLHHHRYWLVEEKIIMNIRSLKSIALYILLSLPLALPITGIMYLDGQVLADGELLDPVELNKSHPLCMKLVHWSLVIALITAFTPFKHISSLAAGIAIGSFFFYGIDLYSQLRDLSEMGLSKQPLIEMVEVSTYGHWLIVMCALCLATQIIYGLALPVIRLKKAACKNTDGLKLSGSE